MSKRKNQPGEGQQTQEYKGSTDIVRYTAQPIPEKLIHSVREYFRLLGAEVGTDHQQKANHVTIYFPDKSEIHVLGGNLDSEISIIFYTEIPRFIFPERAIKILKKRVYKISMLARLAYLDIQRGRGDDYGDVFTMSKKKDKHNDQEISIDTTNETWLMAELERVTKILGHSKAKRVKKRSR